MSRPPRLFSEEKKNEPSESFSPPQHCLVASSRAETILISSAGDVLTARCRNSPYPSGKTAAYQWKDDITALCCDANDCGGDDLSTQIQESSNLCTPFRKNNTKLQQQQRRPKGGLLGGAPAAAVAPHLPAHDSTGRLDGASGGTTSPEAFSAVQESASGSSSPTVVNKSNISSNRAQKAFRSPPLRADSDFDAESIVPIRSFDHSIFYENSSGGNNATAYSPSTPARSSSKTQQHSTEKENLLQVHHGVPTFSLPFANIKVKDVSANPAGSHVLLISNAGLLYSYGLNNFGQLGIGMKSDVRGAHKGFVMTPTIVTPLVENGGKAVACAAGVNHSLVVVETQERRLLKSSRSFDGLFTPHDDNDEDNPNNGTNHLVHHQVYGFGRNDFMKIGLVRPKLVSKTKAAEASPSSAEDEMESVVLPRRVALHATFHKSNYSAKKHENSGLEKNRHRQGVFAVAAGAEHSGALLRKPNGDVELYTWGNAAHGALGLPPHPVVSNHRKQQQQQKPGSGLDNDDGDNKDTGGGVGIAAIVPVPSFVASLSRTSNRVVSLLSDDDGEYPINLSLSRSCSFVVTSVGRCFAFGTSEDGMLGLGPEVMERHQPTEILMPADARDESIRSVSAGASHVVIGTQSGNVYAWGVGWNAGITGGVVPVPPPAITTTATQSKQEKEVPAPPLPPIEWSPKRLKMPFEQQICSGTPQPAFIVQSCAGLDCTLLISQSGQVYSTGQSSGRLGLGELPTTEQVVKVPRPLFGGLHLWKRNENEMREQRLLKPKLPARNKLHRHASIS